MEKAASVEPTIENTSKSPSLEKKKTSENEGYKKMENLMNNSIASANSLLLNDIKISINESMREFKQQLNLPSSGVDILSKINELDAKVNELHAKISALADQVQFDNNWLKISLDGALHKNDVDIKPVVKGEVKAVKAVPKTKAATAAAVVKDVDLSTIKSTNFLKHQLTNDPTYITQKFTDNEEFMSNAFYEHIKSLPLSINFRELPLKEKIDHFLNHAKNNESTNSKLITLLNKNAVFKKSVTVDFESWKSQNKINNNKDFLDEED